MRELIADALDEDAVAERYLAAGERLGPHVVDGQAMVDGALADGDHVLLEGQLGTMRDLDWGVYPYVTSSSPIPGGASLGAGLPAVAIDRVLGMAKAYTTAVGAGPLPTELDDADGERLRERGVENGTSTGRPRRCGWYDAVAVHYSVRLAGYRAIALTKLDVLDDFERIRIGTAYRDPADGREWTTVPASASAYARLEPVYEEVSGWKTDTTACRSWDELPEAARGYVERLEALAGVPITHVSVRSGTCPDDCAMKLGLIGPQGWTGEYDGWEPGRVAADDGGRAARRDAGIRIDLAVRPLPHRARPTDEITFESFTSLAALAALPAGSGWGTSSSARRSGTRR